MGRQQFHLPLAGYMANGIKAKTHQASKVVAFWSKYRTFKVHRSASDGFILTTAKGSYKLAPHMSIPNLWTCTTNTDVICHFSKKKIVAKLVYWA